jgi:hypothetical protein
MRDRRVMTVLLSLALLSACDVRPTGITNDTTRPVQADMKLLNETELLDLAILKPGEGFHIPQRSHEVEFVYLSTVGHPKTVAFKVKDFCSPDDWICDIKVSQLEAKRDKLAVPWQATGVTFSSAVP